MKKIILSVLALLWAGTATAQIALGGKNNITNNSVLLEFEDGNDNVKGIIIPAVTDANVALSDNKEKSYGTFLFDKSDKVIKVYERKGWKFLTESETGDLSLIVSSTNPETAETVGMVIGNDTTDTKGVVVLNHDTKAMVLPKIANPHLNVKNPYPGMMCYDTEKQFLAIFNGQYWYYWK